MQDMTRPSIVEVVLTWLSLAVSGVLGLFPCGLLVWFGTWHIPSEITNTPLREIDLGHWVLPVILAGFLAVALASAGIHVTMNLWIQFAEPRFSRSAIGMVIGGEQHIPKMQKRASKMREHARRITRRCRLTKSD